MSLGFTEQQLPFTAESPHMKTNTSIKRGVSVMTLEQTVQEIAKENKTILKDIATIKARQTNDNDRIKENRALVEPIHQLIPKLEHLTDELKGQNVRMDKHFSMSEERAEKQGERIGRVESVLEKITHFVEELKKEVDERAKSQGERLGKLEEYVNKQNEVLKRVEGLEVKVDEIRMRGSKWWNTILEKGLYVLVGGGLMYILYRIGLSS